jgi:hypothetical protein
MAIALAILAAVLAGASGLTWLLVSRVNIPPQFNDILGFVATATGVLAIVAAVASASSFAFG